jgi:hypothetical protein
MALKKKLIQIPLGSVDVVGSGTVTKGIDQSRDSILTNSPALADVTNLVVDKDGTLKKRFGFSNLSMSGITGAVTSIDSYNDTLFAQTEDGGFVYSESKSLWTKVSDLDRKTFKAVDRVRAASNGTVTNVDHTVSGSLLLTTWTECAFDESVAPTWGQSIPARYLSCWYKVEDITDPEDPKELFPATEVDSSTTLLKPVVSTVASGDFVLAAIKVVFTGSSSTVVSRNAVAYRISKADFAVGPLLALSTSQTIVHIDIESVSGGSRVLVACAPDTATYPPATALEIVEVKDLIGAISKGWNTVLTGNIFGERGLAMLESGSNTIIAASSRVAGALPFGYLHTTSVVTSTGVQGAVNQLDENTLKVTMAMKPSDTVISLYYEQFTEAGSGTSFPMSYRQWTRGTHIKALDGSAFANLGLARGVCLGGKAFYSSIYTKVVCPLLTGGITFNGSSAFSDGKEYFNTPSVTLATAPSNPPAYSGEYPTFVPLLRIWRDKAFPWDLAQAGQYPVAVEVSLSGDVITGGTPNILASVVELAGGAKIRLATCGVSIDKFRGKITSPSIGIPDEAVFSRELLATDIYIGGNKGQFVNFENTGYRTRGTLVSFDGIREMEATAYATPMRPYMATIAKQDLFAKVVWVWKDALGELHRSGASLPSRGGDTSGEVYVAFPSLMEANNLDSYEVSVEVYLSSTVGGVYYLYQQIHPERDPNRLDHLAHAQFQGLLKVVLPSSAPTTGKTLYTTGTILDALSAPNFRAITTFGDRIYGIPDQEPWTVWASKHKEHGVAAEFNDALKISMPETSRGELTALFPIGNRMVLATQEELFWVGGEGPTNAATGRGWGTPKLLSSDTGVVSQNSVVVGDFGVVFFGLRGFYILSPNLELVYVGRAVEDIVGTATPVSSELLPLHKEVRFVMSAGNVLVWNYRLNVWTNFTNLDAVDSTVYQDKFTYIESDGTIRQEHDFYYEGTDAPVAEASFTTSWIKLNTVQGYQRVRRVLLTGHRASGALKVFLVFDYDETVVESHIWSESEMAAITNSSGNFSVNIHVKHQKSNAIKIFVSTADSSNPQFPELYGFGSQVVSIVLEAGVKAGRYLNAGTNTK